MLGKNAHPMNRTVGYCSIHVKSNNIKIVSAAEFDFIYLVWDNLYNFMDKILCL